jgi:capsid protein
MGSGAVQRGERETETLGDGSTRVIEGVAPGMEVFAQPGETIKGWTPNIPQPGFFEHAKLILTFIAINLGLPLHVFLLDPERTNFSGWRGAIDQARLGFRQLQRWLISSFHRPVYQWKVRQWLAEDAVLQRIGQENPKLNLLGHRWQPRAWKYIEPLKDSGDHLLQWRNAMTPGRRIAAERGLGDYADLVREITEDNARLIRSAKQTADQLNKEFPDLNVSWREVACLPTPDGVKLVLKPGAGAEAAEEES